MTIINKKKSAESTMELITCTETEWYERLLDARARFVKTSVETMIEFCREVVEFKKFCAAKQGGTDFTLKACEWLGCDKSTLSRFVAIGNRTEKLMLAPDSLPNDMDSLGRICSLKDAQFEDVLGVVTPDMKRAEIRDLIADVKGVVKKARPSKGEGGGSNNFNKSAVCILEAVRELEGLLTDKTVTRDGIIEHFWFQSLQVARSAGKSDAEARQLANKAKGLLGRALSPPLESNESAAAKRKAQLVALNQYKAEWSAKWPEVCGIDADEWKAFKTNSARARLAKERLEEIKMSHGGTVPMMILKAFTGSLLKGQPMPGVPLGWAGFLADY